MKADTPLISHGNISQVRPQQRERVPQNRHLRVLVHAGQIDKGRSGPVVRKLIEGERFKKTSPPECRNLEMGTILFKDLVRGWIILFALLSTVGVSQAQVTEIHFPKGPGMTVEGTIAGAATATYQVEVPAMARMSVWLESDNMATHFTIAEIGASTPLHDSSAFSAGVSYETEVEGKYVVSVILSPESDTGAAAANYELTFHYRSLPGASFGQRARLRPSIPLKVEWMPNFCKGEVNALFGARGPGVIVLPAILSGSRQFVQGFYDGTPEDFRFQCWFGRDGVYQAVTRNF
jgi:hypothetical protein